MNKKGLLILFVIIMLFTVTGCTARVNRAAQRNETQVKKYVNSQLNNKYNDLNIELDSKEELHTYPSFCLDSCSRSVPVKGGYRYVFNIKDKDENISKAIYEDGFFYNKKEYENRYIEYYKYLNNKELDKYSDIIKPYLTDLKVKNKHYESLYDENDTFGGVHIVYDVDLDSNDLDYGSFALINSFGYDIRTYEEKEHNNSFSYEDPSIYFKFNDSTKPIHIYFYGLNNSSNENKYTSYTDNYNDYYSLRQYFTFPISNDEINIILNSFNNRARFYINRIDNIYLYSSYENKKIIVINNYTRNNRLMKILITCKLNHGDNMFYGDRISILADEGSDTSLNGTVVRSWNFKM